ncbi:hypothetical protein [uncultured Aeromicrobium sp.]|uniref:hypothetical protein n=1 Tax=uncultured Aeromicrobium sp. TaxID=337820 RepID=UPI0025D81870|nr:hypothetical protein [uncultured Aeromicrobium sp.]
MVIVAGIVVSGVVVGLGGGDTVRSAVVTGVCRVTSLAGGTTDCVESSTEGPSTDDTGQGHDQLADTQPEKRHPRCEIDGSTGGGNNAPTSIVVGSEAGGVGTTHSVTLGESRPDENGINWTELSYELRRELQLGAPGGRVELEGFAGGATGLTVDVPHSLIEDGVPTSGLPDPFTPGSIPPGVSVRLDGGVYAGAGAEGAWRGVVGSMDYETAENVSLAVTGGEDGQITVTFGTDAAVRHAASLGLGITELNLSLTDSTDIGSYELQQFTFDLSTTEGQAAYYSLLSGEVPAPDSPGVADSAGIVGDSYARDRAIELKAGGLEVSQDFYSNDVRTALQTNADGTTTSTITQVINGQVRTHVDNYDGDGRLIDSSAQIRLKNVSPDDATGYNMHYAGDGDAAVDAPVNLVLDFSADDIARLADDAITQALHQLNVVEFNGDEIQRMFLPDVEGTVTREDLIEWLENAGDDDIAAAFGRGNSGADQAFVNVLQAIGNHGDDSWAVFAAFTDALDLAGQGAAQTLQFWAVRTEEAAGSDYIGPGSATCVEVR